MREQRHSGKALLRGTSRHAEHGGLDRAKLEVGVSIQTHVDALPCTNTANALGRNHHAHLHLPHVGGRDGEHRATRLHLLQVAPDGHVGERACRRGYEQIGALPLGHGGAQLPQSGLHSGEVLLLLRLLVELHLGNLLLQLLHGNGGVGDGEPYALGALLLGYQPLLRLLEFGGRNVPLGVEQRVAGILAAGQAKVGLGQAQLLAQQADMPLLCPHLRLHGSQLLLVELLPVEQPIGGQGLHQRGVGGLHIAQRQTVRAEGIEQDGVGLKPSGAGI